MARSKNIRVTLVADNPKENKKQEDGHVPYSILTRWISFAFVKSAERSTLGQVLQRERLLSLSAMVL